MTDSLTRATFDIREMDLPDMVLVQEDLPPAYSDYVLLRNGELDNRAMADHGFRGASEERFRAIGRIAGYLREFAPPPPPLAADGVDFAVASVAHLFRSPEGVHDWMREVFLSGFAENVGSDVGGGQILAGIERLNPEGFFDEAVGLKTVHYTSDSAISSTIIDFRVGRVLGVVFVATVGDHLRLEEATELGIEMEKLIVGVALGR